MGHYKKRKLSSIEIAAFCQQIAMILNGGIPLYEGTYMLYEEVEEKKTKEILHEIDEGVKKSMPLYKALEETRAFPEYMIYMVKIGETSGKLEEVMQSLARYYERDSNIRASVKNVTVYPFMLLAMLSIVIGILVTKILPMFVKVVEELNTELTGYSRSMLNIGVTIGRVALILVVGIFCIGLCIVIWNQTVIGRKQLRKVGECLPVLKNTLKEMAVSRFVSAMSLMLSSGMEIKQALELANQVITHEATNKKIKECVTYVEQNESLSEALKKTKLITGMQGRLIHVGIRTGVMDTVFKQLSKQYDDMVEERLSGLATFIETALVVLLTVLVGAILLSVILPLISIISSIG